MGLIVPAWSPLDCSTILQAGAEVIDIIAIPSLPRSEDRFILVSWEERLFVLRWFSSKSVYRSNEGRMSFWDEESQCYACVYSDGSSIFRSFELETFTSFPWGDICYSDSGFILISDAGSWEVDFIRMFTYFILIDFSNLECQEVRFETGDGEVHRKMLADLIDQYGEKVVPVLPHSTPKWILPSQSDLFQLQKKETG